MKNKDEDEFWKRLEQQMKEYSDEEIILVLNKLKLYEPTAQKLALSEAIRRGIIHSEQDIWFEKFRTEPSRFSLFPCPEKKQTILKIVRSISRALLVAGVIPLIFGFLKFQIFKYAEGSAMILTGLIWMTSAWIIFTKQDRRFWPLLFVIASMSFFYVARLLVLLKGLRVMDYVVPAIFFLLVLYSLFYLRKLLLKLVQ